MKFAPHPHAYRWGLKRLPVVSKGDGVLKSSLVQGETIGRRVSQEEAPFSCVHRCSAKGEARQRPENV